MKRSRNTSRRNQRNNNRSQVKQSRSLSYDSLEKRQMLTAGLGFNAIGASLADTDITSAVPNPEGDVGPNHYVEFGEQTFTVYDRNGTIVESTSLNQFFVNTGAELFGEDLNNPRVVYDRATQRWFAVATGDGNGPLAGNWLHIAFSDNSDPTGQWQQLQFVPDVTGVRLNTEVSLGIDADGVYLATRDLIDGNLDSVSVFSIPKADLFLANPTIANLTRFDNLDPAVFGTRIQFASNFEASDGTVYAFSNQSAADLNSFQITDADGPGANLTTPVTVTVDVGNYTDPTVFADPMTPPEMANPFPILQPTTDGAGNLIGQQLIQPNGLTSSLIESNGSVFGARTVSFILNTTADFRTNGINWFQLDVGGGADPELASSPLRGDNSHVIIDTTTLGDNNGDLIPEYGVVTYFNPSIAVNETGVITVVFNGTTQFDAANNPIFNGVSLDDFGVVDPDTGLPIDENAIRVSTFASVGLTVNGAQTAVDAQGDPIYPRQSIQLQEPQVIRFSNSSDPFTQPGPFNFWGGYSSIRPDPTNPNAFFAVVPFVDELSDEWGVQVAEILPIELRPVVEATPANDVIIIRRDAADTDFIEIEINGIVSDRFDESILDQIIVFAHGGADRIVIDHVNGDPTPVGGFVLDGGDGTDTIETNSPENLDFLIDTLNATVNIDYPAYIAVALDASDGRGFPIDDTTGPADGFLTQVTQGGVDLPVEMLVNSQLIDIETIVGGSGDDTFTFQAGPLGGNAEGRGGDDRFVFLGPATVDGSVNGGSGFNTLDLQERNAGTEIELFSTGQNEGFNGRTVSGPVGQFNQILDQFRDISLIRGSTANVNDSIQALNQFEATFTIVAPNIDPNDARNPDDADSFVATTYEAGNEKLYFTGFERIAGSVLDDVFNVQSNNDSELPQLVLDGRTGDDDFNFSSNSPLNTGVTGQILGLIFVEGGGGSNSITVSEVSRESDLDYLVLSARISGPVEVVYADTNAGNFDVTVIGSDSHVDTFILQSFLPANTLNAFGLNGDDVFIIQDLSQAEVELFGGEGDDEYIIEQVNGIDSRNVLINDSVNAENDRAIIAGTILDEIFIVAVDSFESDQFIFIGIEEFGFDGRGGDDEFYVRAISEDFPIILRGGDGNDIFHISSDAPTDLGDLLTLNNDLTIEGGTGINRIIISNESGGALDVEIRTTQITGLFNGVLNYSSEGGVFGLVDEDGNLDDQNFGGIDITGSNGGNDKFLIASFLEQNSLVIDGRLGEDEFIIGDAVGDNVEGVVVVDGASDGDTYTLFLENVATQNVIIVDSGFSGVDTIDAKGTTAGDNISLTEFSISTDDVAIGIGDFIERIEIEGLGGDDFITITNAPAEFVSISGNEGIDFIAVNGTVGVSELMVFGGSELDFINIQGSSLLTSVEVFGGGDNDFIDVRSGAMGDITIDGQDGNDLFTVALVGTGTRTVQIVTSGFDAIDVIGTGNADEFAISNLSVLVGAESVLFATGSSSLSVSGGNGDDVFNVFESQGSSLSVRGEQGNDVFNFSSDAPNQSGNTLGIQSNVLVDGGEGLNRLNITNETGQPSIVTVTSGSIDGLTNGFIFSFAGPFVGSDGEIGGIHIIGSNAGSDMFDVQSLNAGDTIRIEGLGGDDTFTIGNAIAGDALFDGGEGSDTYNFVFGAATAREIVINDTGTTGTDILNLSGSNQDDNIVIAANNVSDGVSTLSFNIPLTVIEIFGLDGNDTFTINDSPTSNVRLHGNIGNDTFIVNNTDNIANLELFGGGDADVFQFNGSADLTRIDADGGNGNDTFTVGIGAFGRLFLDGEQGSDSYSVAFAGNGARRIDTRDSGENGNDVTTVSGTTGNDRIAIRTRRFLYDNEIVIFDENTEHVIANSGEGNDRIVVFGSRSVLTEVFAGAGNDNFVINSGSRADVINLSGEDGGDSFLVRKTTVDTTTNLFGNAGNDRFNIGSTVNQDDGNLGRIRGELNVFGGSNDVGEEDQLVANDNGVNAAYSYKITPTRIAAIAGPANLPRANFAGINYNASTEFVRVDGTPFANLFEVTASQTTRYFFDGNAPTSSIGDRLNLSFQADDGRQLFVTNQFSGNGFVTFANGNERVQFENIESPTLDNGFSNLLLPPGFGDGSEEFDDFFSTADLDDWIDLEDAIV